MLLTIVRTAGGTGRTCGCAAACTAVRLHQFPKGQLRILSVIQNVHGIAFGLISRIAEGNGQRANHLGKGTGRQSLIHIVHKHLYPSRGRNGNRVGTVNLFGDRIITV